MGNTLILLGVIKYDEDHPHIHGEYSLVTVSFVRLVGSPPHTWGILLSPIVSKYKIRITPTYMGNTNANDLLRCDSEDHPHIHGEYENSP